jgi:hypothetical protein
MVISALCGGIGNQMFQYAAGRRLAERRGVDLKLCFVSSDGNTPREYELGVFNIREQFASNTEVAALTTCQPGLARKLFARISGGKQHHPATYIKEKYYHFDPSILDLEGNVYLEGYWQSEKYFRDISPIIRKEFGIKRPPDDRNRFIAEKIGSCESVSIHVRRGDYVTNAETRRVHGICSPEYYAEALRYIGERVNDPHFFIFSDDPSWARDNIRTDFPSSVVDHNGPEHAYEDMRLMSLCRHHIIANSSFSWWGAWLSGNPEKIVVAPSRWFRTGSYDTRDLIPEGWVRI